MRFFAGVRLFLFSDSDLCKVSFFVYSFFCLTTSYLKLALMYFCFEIFGLSGFVRTISPSISNGFNIFLLK